MDIKIQACSSSIFRRWDFRAIVFFVEQICGEVLNAKHRSGFGFLPLGTSLRMLGLIGGLVLETGCGSAYGSAVLYHAVPFLNFHLAV